jgi:AraC-like DNA-binding protein
MVREWVAGPMTDRAKGRYWTEACSTIFFPLDSILPEPAAFRGTLSNWSFGAQSLSRFRTTPVRYRRERHHLTRGEEEQVLVSFARVSPIVFMQNGTTLDCGKGQFVIQRGMAPYDYHQTAPNELWVLKVPIAQLERRIGRIDRHTLHVHDCETGAGGLLMDMVRLMPRRLADTDDGTADAMAGCLVDLLALALAGDPRARHSHLTSVQAAHLARIERHIRNHLAHRSLSPETVAAACGISVRYVHELLRRAGTSLTPWVRALRLDACDVQLRDAGRGDSLAEIAYRWGFADQAQFSRHYKGRFGRTPSEVRSEARIAAAQER